MTGRQRSARGWRHYYEWVSHKPQEGYALPLVPPLALVLPHGLTQTGEHPVT